MSYGDFTIEALRKTFEVTVREQRLFEAPGSIAPSALLQDALESVKTIAFFSEKSRSEFIVAPILLACREHLQRSFQIYSGARLDVDPDKGLKGECDFLVARIPLTPFLEAPILVVLEAKKNDIEEGFAQCGAQLLGVRIYNQREGFSAEALYGCVTTGETWQFLRLQGNELLIDSERYYILEVGKILWVLSKIIKETRVQRTSDAA
jgi:hypothetical protein